MNSIDLFLLLQRRRVRATAFRPRLLAIIAALWGASAALSTASAAEPRLPIFDAHVHYSHDAWDRTPPKEAVAILRKAGLSDEGTQKLYAEAPDLVVPSLRPYRKRGEISTWVRDQTIIPHLEDRLKKYRYAAIGEFHVYGADADLPVVRRMVQLAKQHKLWLHLHGDSDAIERVLAQDPEARILWAHSGFDRPEHANSTPTSPSATTTPRAARSILPGARPSSSSPTASWSGPTPLPPSAGTTSPSTPTGRAPGWPTCRPTSPSASAGATAKPCSPR
jgi:hypothetical protein